VWGIAMSSVNVKFLKGVQVFIKNFHDKVNYFECKLAKSPFHFRQPVLIGVIIILKELTGFATLFPALGKNVFPAMEKRFVKINVP